MSDWHGKQGSIRLDNVPKMASQPFTEQAVAKVITLLPLNRESEPEPLYQTFQPYLPHRGVLAAHLFASIEKVQHITEE